MASSVLMRHTRDQLDSLSRLVAPPPREGPFPLSPEDYHDLVNLVLAFPESYHRTVAAEFRRLFTDQTRSVEQLQRLRSDLADLADRYLALVQILEKDPALSTIAEEHPLFQVTLAKLGEAVALLQRDRNRLIQEWPVGSPEELARVSAERDQGLFLPVDRAFAEMKGISLEELQRRLEEHKAQRHKYGWE